MNEYIINIHIVHKSNILHHIKCTHEHIAIAVHVVYRSCYSRERFYEAKGYI